MPPAPGHNIPPGHVIFIRGGNQTRKARQELLRIGQAIIDGETQVPQLGTTLLDELIQFWGNCPLVGTRYVPTTAAEGLSMVHHWMAVWAAEDTAGETQHHMDRNQDLIVDSWIAYVLGTGHGKQKLGHQVVCIPHTILRSHVESNWVLAKQRFNDDQGSECHPTR